MLGFVGLLLGYGNRFLTVKWQRSHVPLVCDIPFCLTLNLLWTVVNLLWLQVYVVIASIPLAIAVLVGEGAKIIFAWVNVIKLCRIVLHSHLFYWCVRVVEHLYYQTGVLNAADVYE